QERGQVVARRLAGPTRAWQPVVREERLLRGGLVLLGHGLRRRGRWLRGAGRGLVELDGGARSRREGSGALGRAGRGVRRAEHRRRRGREAEDAAPAARAGLGVLL